MKEPEDLSYAKCRELLAAGLVGRVGLCTSEGPVILPVNYAVVGEAVVLRTTADGLIARHAPAGFAFEVDHVDYGDQVGWSVLATGRAEILEDPVVLAQVARTWEPRPWAAGKRDLHLRLAWTSLTGRRLGSGWTRANELPVRRHT